MIQFIKKESSGGGAEFPKVYTTDYNNTEIYKTIISFPSLNTSEMTSMNSMFTNCRNLRSVPSLDTSNVTSMNTMFSNCVSLVNVPIIDTGSVYGLNNIFANCPSLSNDSLNNIMTMCINATFYSGTKTLRNIGLSQEQATTCQGLSNYADFIAAGWTTGY